MAKNKDKKRRYGSAKDNAEKRTSGASYGYIKIPKDVKMFTPEADTTAIIDILPYEVTDSNHLDRIEEGVLWYKKPFKVHKGIGPNDDSLVCPTTFSKPCPICENRDELRKDKDADEQTIKDLKAKNRNIYVVIVREYDGKKKFDKKALHLFDFSDYLFQEVFENQLKKKEAFDTFFLHDSGMSLEITFDEGSFNGGKFAKVTRVDFVERKKQYKDDILESVPNLDEDVLEVMSYDEIEAKFFGEEGVGKDEAKSKDKKKGKKKKDKAKEDAPVETESKKDKKKDKKKGKKEKEVESEEEAAPEKKEKKKSKKSEKSEEDQSGGKTKKDKKGKKDKKSKDECPYNHKFGKDNDKFDDCADCDLWPECKAAKKALKKNK